MAIDIVTTEPWNDPYNPWPNYLQVSVSATDIPLVVFACPDPALGGLGFYFPNNGPDTVAKFQWRMTAFSQVFSSPRFYYWVGLGPDDINMGAGWVVNASGPSNCLYYVPTTNRSLPFKQAGVTGAWQAAQGTDVASLMIQPVLSSVAPWELRRKRLLEYI